jgi:threonine dehydrogenase-like Zn-dependent dehydrogenase
VKGVVLSSERRVELAELPVPEPGQDEVLVRSHFCGICGTDLHAADLEAADRLAADDLPEVDHVMECSGHVLALQTGLDLVAPGGSVRLVGMAPAPVTFDPVQAITKEAQIMTGFIYVEEFPQAIELVASGGVDVDTLVTTLTALEDYADAFTALRAPETTMKVLIETGGSG